MPKEKALALSLVTSPPYAAWLGKLAESSHQSKSALVRQALSEFCERHGLEAPPES